jgi:hypothetical protein
MSSTVNAVSLPSICHVVSKILFHIKQAFFSLALFFCQNITFKPHKIAFTIATVAVAVAVAAVVVVVAVAVAAAVVVVVDVVVAVIVFNLIDILEVVVGFLLCLTLFFFVFDVVGLSCCV